MVDKPLFRKRIRSGSWLIGTFSVAASIGLYGYISHAKGFQESEIKDLQRTANLSMMNSVGLCLLSRRKKTNLIVVPFLCLWTVVEV